MNALDLPTALPALVPADIKPLDVLDGNGTDVVIGLAPDGRLMLYAAWKGFPSRPLTPLVTPAEIAALAKGVLASSKRDRLATWPHAVMVLAMAVALLGTRFPGQDDGIPAGSDDPPGPVAPAAAMAVPETAAGGEG